MLFGNESNPWLPCTVVEKGTKKSGEALFVNFLGSGTLKKRVQKLGCKKQGTKNRDIAIQKE